jgi:hypothetical protein
VTLTFNHIGEAHLLTNTDRERMGMPIVNAMRQQPAPAYMQRDKMGIADRPSTVLVEAIEKMRPSAIELACARHLLWYGGACVNALTAIETARIGDELPTVFQDAEGRPIPYLCISAEDHGVYTLPGI